HNVIVWDLETIPDLKGFAAANYLTGKTDAEIREVMGDKFPKHIYHSIACIGAKPAGTGVGACPHTPGGRGSPALSKKNVFDAEVQSGCNARNKRKHQRKTISKAPGCRGA